MNWNLKTIARTLPTLGLAVGISLSGIAPASAQNAGPAGAMTLEAVEEAYQAGDFATARVGLLPHAEGGGAKSQYRLGYMMANSIGGPFDAAGAKRWLEAAIAGGHPHGYVLLARTYLSTNPEVPDYERAAELLALAVGDEDAEAHFYLGQLYRIGRGVEGDKSRAFELMELAADAGVVNAQFAIAQMYSRGEGVEQDEAQASRWLLTSADAGFGEAQLSLYFNYTRGSGFPKDEAKALKYLTLAVENGETLAERLLGAAYLTGEGVEADPERGVALLLLAAAKGEPGAQSNLGYAYATGTGVEQDDATAAQWYVKAADQGLTRAALVMGDFFQKGRGVEADLAQAIKYYEIAFLGRDLNAAARLGMLVVSGEIPPDQEPEASMFWVATAADQGDEGAFEWLKIRATTGEPYAHFRVGLIYREGTIGEPDAEQAATHIIRAANGNLVAAQELAAEMLATGSGVEQNYVEAHKWANVASANGSETAAERRDVLANLMTADQVADAQAQANKFLSEQGK